MITMRPCLITQSGGDPVPDEFRPHLLHFRAILGNLAQSIHPGHRKFRFRRDLRSYHTDFEAVGSYWHEGSPSGLASCSPLHPSFLPPGAWDPPCSIGVMWIVPAAHLTKNASTVERVSRIQVLCLSNELTQSLSKCTSDSYIGQKYGTLSKSYQERRSTHVQSPPSQSPSSGYWDSVLPLSFGTPLLCGASGGVLSSKDSGSRW